MGAYGGNTYLGNTRTLFEFLSKHSNYRVVWMAKSKTLVKELKKKGYNAIYALNVNAIRLLRKAKFIFITQGIYDLLPIEISPGTTVIQTWHGTPIKKIVLDETNNYAYTKWGNILKLKLKYDQYIDFILTPTTGDLEHKNLSSAFKVPLNKILNLGYPRHDILFNKDGEFVKSLKISYLTKMGNLSNL
jgi:CDP-glycerol glycerophosphotransferase (TagB/SpsB family)